jgi:hypothetical protein
MNFIHYFNGLTFYNSDDRTSTIDRCNRTEMTSPYYAAQELDSFKDRGGIRLMMPRPIPP